MKVFPYEDFDLPIVEVIPQVRQSLSVQSTLVVCASPGAGKSTLLPPALLAEPWLEGKKIIMLEPRRLAARTIAERVAHLMGEKVGESVGYRIRFENRVSSKTRLEVVTEGILTRMLHTDNALEGVGLVIFDEFHERSLHADVALALCREAQQVLRPDLRIMLMSATLDIPKLREILQAPIIESPGRQYPVEIHYAGNADQFLLPELMASQIKQVMAKHREGDILAFLPGEGEIRKCEELLRGKTGGAIVAPLFGQLPFHLQNKAILPDKNGKRRIVLATAIAETSLTIEGVRIVIDCGYSRIAKFDPKSGLSRLETVPITKDAAHQRAGRAGRMAPGFCYRMWSLATHARLSDHRIPEIMETDLTPLVLDMAQWGVANIPAMTWLTPPPQAALSQAFETLHQLEALEQNKITPHGIAMHRLPCHPRIAHMMLMAELQDQVALAADVAALVEERDPLGREAGIDISLRVDALRRHRREQRDNNKMQRIEKVAASYRKLFDLLEDNDPADPYQVGLLLAYAYPERIASARPGNNAQFQLSNGKYAMVGHKDDLAAEPWLAVASLDARDGIGKIFSAAPLNPRDLAPMVKSYENISWDTRKGGLVAAAELRIGSIVLQSKPLAHPDPQLVKNAITEAVQKEGQHLLPIDEEFVQWQHRVLSLRCWRPNETWPDVSTPTLLHNSREWMTFYADKIKSPDDFKKLNLTEMISGHYLTYEQQQLLEKFAPAKLAVPSGSLLPVLYDATGSKPVLAARLQELFGLSETPRVNESKNPVILHLLSPGFKPVQITEDLKSFWNNTYFEVKKELKRRYPKHSWPEDPWTAEAVRGVKRKTTGA